MGKPVGRRRVDGDGRHEKKFKRQPYDYQFMLKVIDYYATTDIASMIARFFPGVTDSRNCTKRKLVSKWKQQREHIEASAQKASTAHQQRVHSHSLATTLPHTAEASIVKWINDFRRDGVSVSSAMLRMSVFEEAEKLGIPRKVFAASWQWQSSFMKHRRYSFRMKTHTGQTVPADALAQAKAFAQEVARTAEIEGITTIYNADQTAVFFELLSRTTVTAAGSKTVWVKCSKKEKEQMTAMVLDNSHGDKFPLFLVMKTAPSKLRAVEEENKRIRHGFGRRLWSDVEPLQAKHNVRIYGNQSAWWTGALTVEFLRFLFGHRSVFSDPVLLLLDDFSGHWVPQAKKYATSLRIVLMKVPPGLTWLCQPADAVWIKPIKDRLRQHWLVHLQEQIAVHRAGSTASPFEIKAPDRGKVARWASEAWDDIPKSMIISGFARCNLSVTQDAAVEEVERTPDIQYSINAVVDILEELAIVDASEAVLEVEHDDVDRVDVVQS